MSRSSVVRLMLLAAALAVALFVPAPAGAAIGQVFTATSSPVTCTVQVGANAGQRFCSASPSRVPSWDGTPIDVSVTLPPEPATGPDGTFPLVSVYHGYGGSKITPATGTTQRWIAKGYAVFSMSDRGFGQSCGGPVGSRPAGCTNGYVRLIDNAYEVRDAQYLIGQLADDGAIDGQKVGATGGSYGGGISYQLGALKNRTQLVDGTLVPWTSPGGKPMQIAAIAPEFGWTDLPYSLIPNGSTLDYVESSPYRGPLGDRRVGIQKNNWSQSLYAGGLLAGGFYAPVGSDPRADITGWNNAANTGGPYDADPKAQEFIDELTRNHSGNYIDDSTPPSPALLSNGWNDDLFPVDEAVRYYNKVRSKYPTAPISMFHLDFGHSPRSAAFGVDVAQLTAAENAWFDYYVKGTGSEPADARGGVDVLTSNCTSPTTTTRIAGVRFHATSWAALAPGEVRLDSPAPQTITAPGTAPSNAFTSGSVCTTTSSADNASAATYKLDPAPAGGFTLAGSPTVLADLTVAGANDGVYARLYDVDPGSSTQRLIARQVYRPTGVGQGPTRQVFQLHPQAWNVAVGHVVKLELLAQDSTYGRTSTGQQSVGVSNLQLRLPTIETPGALGGLVQTPLAKALPAGYELARDFDTAAPLTTIDTGPSGTIESSSATFSFSSSKARSTFECKLDGGAFGACSGPGQTHTVTGLTNGEHTFSVRATDRFGNVDPVPPARTFTVAVPDPPSPPAPPAPPKPPVARTADGKVGAGTWQLTKSGKVRVKYACTGTAACEGTITLKTAEAVGDRGVVKLGSRSFGPQGAGKEWTVATLLSDKGRRLVQRLGKVKVVVAVSLVNRSSGPSPRRLTRTVTLKAA